MSQKVFIFLWLLLVACTFLRPAYAGDVKVKTLCLDA